tara:strand:- start:60 stop:338 length:279 start_codon:yes stop_codon:yes gene_type:complete
MAKLLGISSRLVSYVIEVSNRKDAEDAAKRLEAKVSGKNKNMLLIDIVRARPNNYSVIFGWGHLAKRWVAMRRGERKRGYKDQGFVNNKRRW